MHTREVSHEDAAWIDEQVAVGIRLVKRYDLPVPADFSLSKIASAIQSWRRDAEPHKPAETEVTLALGCLLGTLANARSDAHWVRVQEDIGSRPAVRHLPSDSLFFPLDIISATLENGDVEEISNAFDAFGII